MDLREKNLLGSPETISAGPAGEAQNRSVRVMNYNWENYLTYIKTFGVHHINIVGGMSYQQSNYHRIKYLWQGFPHR